jgi:hypothetical protein
VTTLQERLRDYTFEGDTWILQQEAADRIDADEALMRNWLARIKTCQSPDYDNVMIGIMGDIRARLEQSK